MNTPARVLVTPLRMLVAALLLSTLTTAAAADLSTPPAAVKGRGRVCLVLSGGGARGIAHIGVLKVLERMRVPVDCVVGTSAGSIIGGAYAAGHSPEEIETLIHDANWDLLLSDQPARYERSVYAKELDRAGIGSPEVGLKGPRIALPRGVLAGQHLQFFLQKLVAPAERGSFDALAIQYRAIATNFENGAMTVLDQGDLASAIRASMSVPGAFAPVEIDGHVLVDGGLVRNVGIDVARALGAERLIVVNVGSSLLKRSEIDSFLAAAEQTLNILTEQNVAASLASLGPNDILITPELGAFSAANFKEGYTLIPAGEAAANRVAAQLATFAVSETDYSAWETTQRHTERKRPYDRILVETSGLKRVPAASIERLLGADPAASGVDGAVTTLLGTDDFQTVSATLEDDANGTALILHPVEKPWGPNYVHAGAVLSSDFSGNGLFSLEVDHRATWLTPRGLEWRNRASLGRVTSLASELREPLDAARHTYIAPRFEVSEEYRDLYYGRDPVANYLFRHVRMGTGVGARLGNYGEVSVGLEWGTGRAILETGIRSLPDLNARVAAWRVDAIIDRLDDLDFPRSGYLLRGEGRLGRKGLGSDENYNKVVLEAEGAFGTDTSSLLLAARYGSALGSNLPVDEAFTLGGFQNLSGYKRDQILTDRATLLRAVYKHQLAQLAPFMPVVYGGVSFEAADVGLQLDPLAPKRVFGGSLFLGASSALGPLYFGAGFAERRFWSLYINLGRVR